MTWDEKLIGLLTASPQNNHKDHAGTYAIYYDGVSWGPGIPLMRYFFERNGRVLRWQRRGPDAPPNLGKWRTVTSPRVRKAVLMAVWPQWEPSD